MHTSLFLPSGLWSLCLCFPVASPRLDLSGTRQASYHQPQGVPLAAERSLTHQVPALSYHICAVVLGQVITRSLWKGLRPHLTTGLGPTPLWTLMVMVTGCTFSEWFGSANIPEELFGGKQTGEKPGGAEVP